MKLIKGLIMSIGMYSIIPVPKKSWNDKYMQVALPALPLVGIIIGLLWYGLSLLLINLPIPVMIKSATVLFIPFILSGFLHLDGYMDTADAVFSRRKIDEKKRILKDPHTGAFAVIALAGLLIFQFSAVYTIIDAQKNLLIIAFIPVISRCIASIAALRLKPVYDRGYIASFKKGTKIGHTVFICVLLLIFCTAAWFLSGFAALPLLVGVLTGVLVTWYLYKQFQGISGDLCGCIITVCELTALLCMALQ
jgi:adenosylcobinamide-GDP ribazoletransferase